MSSFSKKLIVCLLLICFLFSFVPVEYMPYAIVPEAFAETPGYPGNFTDIDYGGGGTPGQRNGGVVNIGPIAPTVIVSLSRNSENFLEGLYEKDGVTETQSFKEYKNYYATRQPNGITVDNTLYFVQPNQYDWMMDYTSRFGNVFGFFSYDASSKDMVIQRGREGQLRRISKENNVPANTFQENVLRAVQNGTITCLEDIQNTWSNYLPTLEEANKALSYIFYYDNYYSTGFKIDSRISEFVEGKGDTQTFTINYAVDNSTPLNASTPYSLAKDTFNIAGSALSPEINLILESGYAGLLACLYVVAKDANKYNSYSDECNIYGNPAQTLQMMREASPVESAYADAISDYLGGIDIKERPVSLVLEPGLHITYNFTDFYIAPALDAVQYAYLTPATAALDGDPVVAGQTFAPAAGNTKEQVRIMAEKSAAELPYLESWSYANPDKPFRAVTAPNGCANPFAVGYYVFGFNKFRWIIQWNDNVVGWNHNFSGFMDLFVLYGDVKGFMMATRARSGVGSNSSPKDNLRISIVIDSTSLVSEDSCSEETKASAFPSMTWGLVASDEIIEYFKMRTEANDFDGLTLNVNIYRETSIMDSTSTTVIEPKKKIDELSFSRTYNGSSLISALQGGVEGLSDFEILNKTYMRENSNKHIVYTYTADATIEYDKTVRKLKTEDIFERLEDGRYANFAALIVPFYDPDVLVESSVGTASDIDPVTQQHSVAIPTVVKRYEFSTAGYEFAEVKEGSILNETYEAMAGVPSTETLYYSVGGSEFKLSVVVQYWINQHNRDRTYLIHFTGNDCEFNNNKKDKGDIFNPTEATSAFSSILPSNGSATISLTHEGMTIQAQWSGTVANDAEDSKIVTAPATGHGNHETSKYDEIVAKPNLTEYKEAIADANAFMNSVASWSSSNLTWTAASDKVIRTVNIPVMSLGTGNPNETPGGSGSADATTSEGAWLTGSATASFTNPETTSHTTTNSSTCNETFKDVPNPPDPVTGESTGTHQEIDHECDATTGPKDESFNKGADGSYTITVTYTLQAHALCGPCCGHTLPDLYDGWRQGLVFDTVKISQLRLYKLDQGQASGFEEVLGTDRVFANVMSGNPTYFMNIASLTDMNYNSDLSTGTILGYESDDFINYYAPNALDTHRTSGFRSVLPNPNRDAVSQSSRDGRLRYYVPTASKGKTDTIEYSEQGNGVAKGIFTVSWDSVVSTEQHDDVIYTVGPRSRNCDGMATSNNFGKNSIYNVEPSMDTGHVNEWADGCLYTYTPGKAVSSDYYMGANYTPKQGVDNDVLALDGETWDETIDRHTAAYGIANGGEAIKTSYSDKADSKDELSPEWRFFDKARNVEVVVDVLADFLILQTSGGDQSIIYYDKESEVKKAQEHFPKLIVTAEEVFDNNDLSVWNSVLTCESGSANKKQKYKDIDMANMIVIGGYNGRYDEPTKKYMPYSPLKEKFLSFGGTAGTYNSHTHEGTYQYWGDTQITTIFDNDPAKTVQRPLKTVTNQGNSFKIYQDNLQIIPTTRNQSYSFKNSKVWYAQQIAYWNQICDIQNMIIGGTVIGPAGNVANGLPVWEKYGQDYIKYWGTTNGLDYESKYFRIPSSNEKAKGEDNSGNCINDIIIFTPVSTYYAMVLPQGDLEIEDNMGVQHSVSRDQRVNSFDFANMNDVINSFKTCPLDPALCEFRRLECDFERDVVLSSFDFNESSSTQVTDSVTGNVYTLPSGFTVSGGKLKAQGIRWSIPFSQIGLSNTKQNKVKISMDITLTDASKPMMVASFQNYGFIIDLSKSVGSFAAISYLEGHTNELGARSDGTINALNNAKLELTFGFNSIIDCSATINGTPVELTISELRDEWTDSKKVVNGNEITYRQRQVVQKALTDLDNDMPNTFAANDIGSNLNIGSWGRSNAYSANFTIDNLAITLLGGTHSHDSTCYSITKIHQTNKVHVHNANCYADQDIYLCDYEYNYYGYPACGFSETSSGQVITVNYLSSKEVQSVTLTPGNWVVELYGASGGTASSGSYAAGKGGYSKGTITVRETTTYYVAVGGQGANGVYGSRNPAGGFNGGGNGYSHEACNSGAAGGGATSLSTVKKTIPELSGNKSAVLMVAGGGGGAGQGYTGGNGGGANMNGTASGSSNPGLVNSGYSFGQGAGAPTTTGNDGDGSNHCGGAGGGYYGGYASKGSTGGGGGSGYANIDVFSDIEGKTGEWTGNGKAVFTNVGHTHEGTPGNTPNGCYTELNSHVHNGLSSSCAGSVPEQTVYEFNYSGYTESVPLPSGTYLLEVWGASGGNFTPHSNAPAGKGGYSSAVLTLNNPDTLYVTVGGKGADNSWRGNGGFNGGGKGSAPGGGATHIATVSGILSSLEGSKSEVILVAGGGAGSSGRGAGGAGGSAVTSATDGVKGLGNAGTAGTASSGGITSPTSTCSSTYYTNGSFGQGGNNTCPGGGTDSGSGGGGGYYGGGAGSHDHAAPEADDSSGGGGSGYANTINFHLSDIKGETGVQQGNGYAKITWLGGQLDPIEIGYTGSVKSIVLYPGKYQLEAWGAQGANLPTSHNPYSGSDRGVGGLGGYSSGILSIDTVTTLYIVVGGKGIENSGGYNGGGSGFVAGGGGGGATHIATIPGTLSTLKTNIDTLLIVAGGGGGAQYGDGGVGGGANENGGNAPTTVNGVSVSSFYGTAGVGGTLSLGYDFGQGGPSAAGTDGLYGGAGGGGYYGGYGAISDVSRVDDYGGGGGSGYANTSKLKDISGESGVQHGDGLVIITPIGHVHSDDCYIKCPKISKGEISCDGQPNTITDKNVHVHDSTCFTDYYELDFSLYAYKDSVQTYKVPYTDWYTLEIYYGHRLQKVDAYLTAGRTLYIYVGNNTYHSNSADIRSMAIPTSKSEYGEVDDESNKKASDESIIIYAKDKDSGIGDSNVQRIYKLENEYRKDLPVLSEINKVVIIPHNSDKDNESVYSQIINGKITSETLLRKYLGDSVYELFATQTTVVGRTNVILSSIDIIPDTLSDGTYNPIFICKFAELNKHICSTVDGANLCRTNIVLNCNEPHHRGEHYGVSNTICWKACKNENNEHNNSISQNTNVKDSKGAYLQLAEFLQLDEGFTVYFPNKGDFSGSAKLGLQNLAFDRYTHYLGYHDYMDTTQWTREKRVKFSFDVIYYDEDTGEQIIYLRNTWIELDVTKEYFNFYLLSENSEMSNAKVDFEVEAINCGTGVGLNLHSYNAKYTDSYISSTYDGVITNFIKNYQSLLDSYVVKGFKIPYAKFADVFADISTRNNATNQTAKLKFGEFGWDKFFTDKAENIESDMRRSVALIGDRIAMDFQGNSTGYAPSNIFGKKIWPHTGISSSINSKVKLQTQNDNKTYTSNRLRTVDYQSLHGAYKSFYLDIIGRIGNFTIMDTGDYRFDNFFKKPVVSDTSSEENIKNMDNWLVAGVVWKVDRSKQNYYIGDTYDIRGNLAIRDDLSSNDGKQLNTHDTQSWLENGILVAPFLTGDVNNVDEFKTEQLHYGYEIFTSIETLGSYSGANVQIVPKYYALKVTDEKVVGLPDLPEYQDKGSIIPVDVYMTLKGDDGSDVFALINKNGNAGNGNSNIGGLNIHDYILNLEWSTETVRRNYGLEEQERTRVVQRFFMIQLRGGIDPEETLQDDYDFGNMDDEVTGEIYYTIPNGEVQLLGSAQYMLLDGNHRTFVGSSKTYGSTVNGTVEEHTYWNLIKDLSTDFGIEKNIVNKNGLRYFNEAQFNTAVQRWHWKVGVPSSAIFIPSIYSALTSENSQVFMNKSLDGLNDNFVILCTAEVIAVGTVWSIAYSQPWINGLSVNGETFRLTKHNNIEDGYPGHRDENDSSLECEYCIPPIIAVFGASSSQDIEILHTH